MDNQAEKNVAVLKKRVRFLKRHIGTLNRAGIKHTFAEELIALEWAINLIDNKPQPKPSSRKGMSRLDSAKRRERVIIRHKAGVSVWGIAEAEGITEAYVRMIIKIEERRYSTTEKR